MRAETGGQVAFANSLSLILSPHPPLPTPQALRKLNAKLAREGTERRAAERERYLKPKYQRQKAASDAIFRSAMRRKNILLSDLYRLDPSLAPFG